MAFKFTSLTIIGTLWKSDDLLFMVTGPIADGKRYNFLNMQTGLLHWMLKDWSFEEILEELKQFEYIGHLHELDIQSFIEEKACLKKIS